MPLWVPSGRADFEVVSMSGSQITVAGTEYTDRYALHGARSDLALMMKDKTMSFRHINSAAPSGGNDVLTVSSSVAGLLPNLKRLCFLKRCRLDADAVELAWMAARGDITKVRVTLRFTELIKSPD